MHRDIIFSFLPSSLEINGSKVGPSFASQVEYMGVLHADFTNFRGKKLGGTDFNCPVVVKSVIYINMA